MYQSVEANKKEDLEMFKTDGLSRNSSAEGFGTLLSFGVIGFGSAVVLLVLSSVAMSLGALA